MTTLTKEDLQALRHADSIVFRTDPTGSEIVCSLKVKINQLAGEITHTIKCEHTHAGYSPDRSRTKLYKAVYVDMYLQTTPEAPWNTISKQLRQGEAYTVLEIRQQ